MISTAHTPAPSPNISKLLIISTQLHHGRAYFMGFIRTSQLHHSRMQHNLQHPTLAYIDTVPLRPSRHNIIALHPTHVPPIIPQHLHAFGPVHKATTCRVYDAHKTTLSAQMTHASAATWNAALHTTEQTNLSWTRLGCQRAWKQGGPC